MSEKPQPRRCRFCYAVEEACHTRCNATRDGLHAIVDADRLPPDVAAALGVPATKETPR